MTLTSPDSQPAAKRTAKAPRRAGVDVLTLEELAERLRVSVMMLRGMLEMGSFFPGAWREGEDGWSVPERAVRAFLGRRLEPLFTVAEAAEYLRLHKETVKSAVAAWLRGDRQRGIESVELTLPGSDKKRVVRITATELERHILRARSA